MKKIITFIEKTPFTKFICTILIIGMAIIMTMNAILRHFFHFSFNWGDEILRYVSIYMAFAGIVAGFRYGKHISITVVTEHLIPEKLRPAFRILSDVCSIIFMGLLVYFGIILVQRIGASGQLSTAMRIPMAAIYAAVPVCGVLSIVQILIQMFVDKSYLQPRE